MMATINPDNAVPYQADQMSPEEACWPIAMARLTAAAQKTTRIGSGGP
jgi:hypothetical protein